MLSRRRFILNTGLAAGAILLRPRVPFVLGQQQPATPHHEAWQDRMIPVRGPTGWEEDDYFCWGGDAIIGPGEQGPETVHFYGALAEMVGISWLAVAERNLSRNQRVDDRTIHDARNFG